MFADPFPAHYDSAGAEVTKPFTLIALGPNSSVRRDNTALAGKPKTLKISHSQVGKGTKARMRHLVRLESYGVLADGVTEDPSVVASVHCVLDLPNVGISHADLYSLWKQFVGLIRGASGDAANEGNESAFFHRWHNGES